MTKKAATTRLKFLKIAVISLGVVMSLTSVTLAQSTPASDSGTSGNNGTVTQPSIIPAGALDNQKLYLPYNSSGESTKGYMENRLLPGIASSIIGITGALALLFTVISGIMMLVSYGNTDMFGKARKALIASLAGVIIAGLSYAIVKIISTINTDSAATPKTTAIVKIIASHDIQNENTHLYN